jgi:hypothetical protein
MQVPTLERRVVYQHPSSILSILLNIRDLHNDHITGCHEINIFASMPGKGARHCLPPPTGFGTVQVTILSGSVVRKCKVLEQVMCCATEHRAEQGGLVRDHKVAMADSTSSLARKCVQRSPSLPEVRLYNHGHRSRV